MQPERQGEATPERGEEGFECACLLSIAVEAVDERKAEPEMMLELDAVGRVFVRASQWPARPTSVLCANNAVWCRNRLSMPSTPTVRPELCWFSSSSRRCGLLSVSRSRVCAPLDGRLWAWPGSEPLAGENCAPNVSCVITWPTSIHEQAHQALSARTHAQSIFYSSH